MNRALNLFVVQGVYFIVTPSSEDLSYRKPASAVTSRDRCRAQENGKTTPCIISF